jgi:hypothetical protein
MTEIHESPGTVGYDDDAGFDDVVTPETTWPKVIGVFSLIYAMTGMLCITAITISTLFLSAIMMQMGGMDIEIPLAVQAMTAAMGTLTVIVGVVMMVGAVGLLRRRRSGVKWLKRWSILRLVLLFIGIGLTFATGPTQMDFQRQMVDARNDAMIENDRPDLVQEKSDEQIWNQILLQTAIFTGLYAIYPVFLGLFLSRRSIADEVDSWG